MPDPSVPSSASPTSILCVDDNQPGLLIRKQMLELFGFDVTLAISGMAALEIMSLTRFAVAVIDYHMPIMDGAELTDHIRDQHPDTRIIMLSGYPHEIPPRTLQMVDAMLVKGERPERLLETVLRLTGRERRRRALSQQELRRRNSDHIAAVRSFLKENAQRRH